MAHRYLSDEALDALTHGRIKNPAPTRYSVPTSIKPNTYRKPPRAETIAITDTLVTRADGTQYVIGKDAERKSNTRKLNAKTQAQILHERMMQLPTIHETR